MKLFDVDPVVDAELIEIENAAYAYAEEKLAERNSTSPSELGAKYTFDKVANFLIDLDTWKQAVEIERADRYLGNGVG